MNSYFFKSTVSLAGAIILLAGFTPVPVASGCASCGGLLDSDWDRQGFYTEPGFKFDVVYAFINQNKLRSGTRKIPASAVPEGQELEDYTRNNYVTLDLDYLFSSAWSVSLKLPYIVRDHATFGEDHHSYDTSSTSSFGDISLLATYQGFLPKHNLGVQLGVTLPTGSFTDTFRSGEALDRGLQPGTGTTGLVAGIYYFDTIGKDWGYFGQVTMQTAFNYRSDYKPGTAENFSLGLRYTRLERVIPQFQVNARIAGRDLGADADNFDSGGSLIYLSPGVTVEVTKKVSAYLFVQVPVYQNLNGYQLAPTWTLSAGIHTSF